jgi:GMP reductase
MCANMGFASFTIAKKLAEHKIITCLHKYHTMAEIYNVLSNSPELIPYIWVSIGYKKSDLDNLLYLKNKGISPNICVDVPNAQMDVFVQYCKKVRDQFPESIILAGNVTNTSSTQELLIYGGVDIIKCGIGGGSACTTRFITGCGMPQLSCCLDNSYIAHGLKSESKRSGLICSDGGHKTSGDVCKALCAGADFAMLGGFFSGAEECDGEWEYEYKCKKAGLAAEFWQPFYPGYETEKRKTIFTYYGMSSHHAQDLYEDGKKSYRASEGTKVVVKNKGPVSGLVQELLGGIRSCCCYIGSHSIKDMSKCSEFYRVSKVHNNNNPVFGI